MHYRFDDFTWGCHPALVKVILGNKGVRSICNFLAARWLCYLSCVQMGLGADGRYGPVLSVRMRE